MKKVLFISLSTILSIFIYQCDNLNEPELDTNLSSGKYEEYGLIHNDIVLDVLNNFDESEHTNGRSLTTATETEIINYLDSKYGTDLSNSPYYIFAHSQSTSGSRLMQDEFDPYAFLESKKDSISPYFHDKFLELLSYTQEFEDNPEYVAGVINDFQIGVFADENFDEIERENFLVMLSVYRSSLDLWTFVDEAIQGTNGRSSSYCKANAWQIPTADMIGGLGGAVGGPATMVAGLAASSLIQAMSVCFSSNSFSSLSNYCSTNIDRSCLPNLKATRPSGISNFYLR